MPSLTLGNETIALPTGTHTIGGRSAESLRIGTLETHPAVADITVPRRGDGRALIRRTTASVVVRVNDEPLGIAAVELRQGATIDFNGLRLTYEEGAAAGDAQRSADDAPITDALPRLASSIGARLTDAKSGRTWVLTDRRVVLGRDDTCDVVIGGKGVSRRHASISPSVGGYLLRDESSNGTFVNGTPLSGTHKLAHDDLIEIAEEQLRFETEEATEVKPRSEDDATQLLDLSHITRGMSLGPKSSRRISCTLEIVRGPLAGTTFDLDKPVCSIGRAAHNDVKLRDESVSSSHATLLRKGDVWYVVDLRSANGTFVDGSRTAGERELATGSHLRIGAVDLIFRAFKDGVREPDARPRSSGIRKWLRERFGGNSHAMAS